MTKILSLNLFLYLFLPALNAQLDKERFGYKTPNERFLEDVFCYDRHNLKIDNCEVFREFRLIHHFRLRVPVGRAFSFAYDNGSFGVGEDAHSAQVGMICAEEADEGRLLSDNAQGRFDNFIGLEPKPFGLFEMIKIGTYGSCMDKFKKLRQLIQARPRTGLKQVEFVLKREGYLSPENSYELVEVNAIQ